MLFVVVYQREAHAGQLMFANVEQPVTAEERKALAEKACSELAITSTLVIDKMDDAVRKAYGGLPNSAYIIDKGGLIVHKEAWAKPEGWRTVLDRLTSRKPVDVATHGLLAQVHQPGCRGSRLR